MKYRKPVNVFLFKYKTIMKAQEGQEEDFEKKKKAGLEFPL
jgi:hypothetical protein